jgi:HK97 family phage portal protein
MRSTFGLIRDSVRGLSNKGGPPVPYTGKRQGLFDRGSATVDADRIYEAYGSVGTLFAIVRQLGDAFSSVEWGLYRKSPLRDKAQRKEVTTHAIKTLWDNPNPFYTGMQFRETVQQHLDLVGEGVIVLNTVGKLPIEMWPVRPDRIQPIKHPTKFLTGYMYVANDGEEVPLTLDQVIHIKLPNPKDPYRGLGPVQSALSDIDAARYSAEWNKNFFINGARPGGVIEIDYKMSDDELLEFLDRWRMQHQGVSNAHRVAVLENAKWQDTQFSMTDMQFVEMRNLSREMIREAFAYPKPMLGSVDDVNRANGKVGEVIFGRWQLQPRLRRWRDVVNYRLVPRFVNGPALELDYENPVPVDQIEETQILNNRATAMKTMTDAGVSPEDAMQTAGLPAMEWVGPSTQTTTPTTS